MIGRTFTLTFALTLAIAGTLVAQDPPSRVGRIGYVSGTVSFEPAGVDNWVPAVVNRPLTMGDQLYADSGGRAEVNVPGAHFRLGDRTAFEFMNLDDRTVQVRLSEGTLDVRVRNLYGNIEVDTPNMAFTVSQPGEYRVDMSPDGSQTLVTDRDGQGQVMAAGGSFALHAGQQAVIQGQGQAAQYKINAAPGYDAFDNWVISRNKREDQYARSGYASPEMVGYEDLGAYGTWRDSPDYGEMWVPNGVSVGWAPYHDGHWVWIDPWGWTWVDDAPWGFAPFHYGRWAFVNGYWGWCPGPVAVAPIYAPALVAWLGFGGGFGVSIGVGAGPAVGWFPLGPRDVYIPAFTASAAFVSRINVTNSRMINASYVNNIYGGYERTRSVPVAGYMNRSVPGAVMAVPQNAFVAARPVQQVALRVTPNQIAGIRTGVPAPRVAPQLASVLGRTAGGNVAHPPAAVMGRQVIARTAPPAAPPSFQQRQALLAANPGRPLGIGQMHALASSHGPTSARFPARVETQTRMITPQVAHAGKPGNIPAARQSIPAQRTQQRPAASQVAHTAPPRNATAQRAKAPAERAQQRPATPQVAHTAPPRNATAQRAKATAQRTHQRPAAPQVAHAKTPHSVPAHTAPSRNTAEVRQHAAAKPTPHAAPARPAPRAEQASARPAATHSTPRRETPQTQAQKSPAREQPRLQAMHRPPAPPSRQPAPERRQPERR